MKVVKKMKLSVETAEICGKFGNEEDLRLIKNAGFDAVDFSYYDLPEVSHITVKQRIVEYMANK